MDFVKSRCGSDVVVSVSNFEFVGRMAIRLNYRDLVTEYHDGLLDNLRGHGVSSQFLEMWVPDEDLGKSLTNLFESAQILGVDHMVIEIEHNLINANIVASIQQWLIEIGTIEFEEQILHSELRFVAASQSPSFADIPACFRKKFQQSYGEIDHEGALKARDGLISIEGHVASARLSLAIDPISHVIHAARHAGLATPADRVVMDKACMLAESRPLKEMVEHVAVRLVEYFQDPEMPPIVPGIILPQNAGHEFLLARDLFVAAYAKYPGKAALDGEINFYHELSSPAWLAEDAGRRLDCIETEVISFITQHKLDLGQIRLLRVDNDRFGQPTRAFFSFDSAIDVAAKPKLLRDLERALKSNVERSLLAYTEVAKDESPLRRL